LAIFFTAMTGESLIGGFIAFVCAVFAVGSDAQTEVRKRFSSRYGTFILRAWPGFAFIIFWGIVDVGFYIAFLFNHEWAKRAFNIDVEPNAYLMGLTVGLSAILIIRTNLATVGSISVGGEHGYLWSRAKLVDLLNRKRVRIRRNFLARYKPYCANIAAYHSYFTSLERNLRALAAGSAQQFEIEEQLKGIKDSVTAPATPDTTVDAREDLTALCYDYFGPDEVDGWATSTDYGNR
jgi:hypothetical protein